MPSVNSSAVPLASLLLSLALPSQPSCSIGQHKGHLHGSQRVGSAQADREMPHLPAAPVQGVPLRRTARQCFGRNPPNHRETRCLRGFEWVDSSVAVRRRVVPRPRRHTLPFRMSGEARRGPQDQVQARVSARWCPDLKAKLGWPKASPPLRFLGNKRVPALAILPLESGSMDKAAFRER